MDLSTTTDVTAFVLLFPPESAGEPYHVLPYFWVPTDNAHKRERRDRVPYSEWINRKFVFGSEGTEVHYDPIRAFINELGRTYNIRAIARDRWNASHISTQLMGDGFEVNDFGQGYASMNAPTKELERLVLAGHLSHGANPVLRWMAQNTAVETDGAGNTKPSKKRSADRIDGIVATIMALGMAINDPTEGSPEVFAI